MYFPHLAMWDAQIFSGKGKLSTMEQIVTRKRRVLHGQKLEWFLEFWEAFAWKLGRSEAADAWLEIDGLDASLVAKILAGIEASRRPKLRAQGRTPKQASGWLNGRRWEDEIPEDEIPPKVRKRPEYEEKWKELLVVAMEDELSHVVGEVREKLLARKNASPHVVNPGTLEVNGEKTMKRSPECL